MIWIITRSAGLACCVHCVWQLVRAQYERGEKRAAQVVVRKTAGTLGQLIATGHATAGRVATALTAMGMMLMQAEPDPDDAMAAELLGRAEELQTEPVPLTLLMLAKLKAKAGELAAADGLAARVLAAEPGNQMALGMRRRLKEL